MQNQTPSRVNLDLVSLAVGIGGGILATLLYATYKQREFDGLIGKSREIANGAGEMVEHGVDEAKALANQAEHAIHDGVRSVGKASKDTLEAVKSSMH